MYSIEWERAAGREFDALPSVIAPRVLRALQGLATEPRPHGVRKLKGRQGYRIRVGDYRVVYKVDDADRVAHRRDVYRT